MATLSRSKQYERLERMGRSIHEIQRQRTALNARFKREMRKMIVAARVLQLNNAEIARMIGGVSAESVRLHAEAIGAGNPRAIKKRGGGAASRSDSSPPDPS